MLINFYECVIKNAARAFIKNERKSTVPCMIVMRVA